MAFVSYGSLGSANKKVQDEFIDLDVSRTVDVGHFVVLWIAWEQDYYSGVGPEGNITLNLKAEDSAGNIYATLMSWMYESNTALLIGQVQNALGVGDTITVTHRANHYYAKAVSAWEFGVTQPLRNTWARMDRMALASVRAGDPPAIAFSTIRGGLWLHSLAANGPSTDSYTWDAAWTEVDADGTTGGAADSNMTVRGGWRISDSTSLSIDVTNNTAGRNTDEALVVLCEVPFVDFPQFPVIDDFNRADEDPLSSTIWDYNAGCFPTFGYRGMRIVNNQAAISMLAPGAGGANTLEDGAECYREAYATLASVGNVSIGFDGTGCGNLAYYDGKAAQWWPCYGCGGGPGRAVDAYFIVGEVGFTGGPCGVGVPVWVTPENGYKLGVQRDYRDLCVIHGWSDLGSGWQWMAAYVESAFPSTAGEYFMSGWGDVNTRIEDFGGGGMDCPTYEVALNWRYAQRHISSTRALLNPSDIAPSV